MREASPFPRIHNMATRNIQRNVAGIWITLQDAALRGFSYTRRSREVQPCCLLTGQGAQERLQCWGADPNTW